MTNPNQPDYANETVDVCIIGSGAGGAPLAHELAKAGAKVVVLEKGPWYKQSEFDHDEIKNSRRDYWVPYVSDEPHVVKSNGAMEGVQTSDGWTSNCVGGGTVHMSGFFYRLSPDDFGLKTKFGKVSGMNLADWPIEYKDLAPYYDRAELEIGVSGKQSNSPFAPPRKRDFPLPPLATNPLGTLIDKGGEKVGVNIYDTPRGILSQDYQGRKACVYCDFCGSYGCESGAKSSTLSAVIPKAVATGRCEVRPESMVYELVVAKSGKVSEALYFDKDGNRKSQKARIFVVSATSVESARLLLNSKSNAHPDGLGNASGQVGRNLTFSTLGKGYGEFEVGSLPNDLQPHHPIHFINRSTRDFYFIDKYKGDYNKGGAVGFLLPHRNPIFTAERISKKSTPPSWGAALQRDIKRHYDDIREIEFEIYGEFAANPNTFVNVEGEVKDKWGLPVATIHVHNHPLDVKNSNYIVRQSLDVLSAAGAKKTEVEHIGGTTYILQHGTCRMGQNKRDSVLNAQCRSHEVENLYVVDGSFMPSSGGIPTTLTIMANSLRVADHMVAEFKKGNISREP